MHRPRGVALSTSTDILPMQIKSPGIPLLQMEFRPARTLIACLAAFVVVTPVTIPHLFAQASPVVDASARRPGSVEGSLAVKDSRTPAVDVTVTVRETGQTTRTDQLGRYRFESVLPGTYTLIATGDGYGRTRITDVVVQPGAELTLSRQAIIARSSSDTVELADYVVSARREGVIELDDYYVEGRRERPFAAGNLDLVRTENDIQPYHIFEAREIELSGAMNVEDFLRERVTMNTVMLTAANQGAGDALSGNMVDIRGSDFSIRGGTSTVDLRGLGSDKTLILINGRRAAGIPGFFDERGGQPDLNGIPPSAVERIEILPTSASGIYGGNAIGGVVNVVLKKGYQGGEIRARYGNQFDTDAPTRAFSFSYGAALEGGRTHVRLSAGWTSSKPMLVGDRRAEYEEARRHLGIEDTYGILPALGSLVNIAAAPAFSISPEGFFQFTAPNLTLKPAYGGQALGSPYTHVPAGTDPSATPASLGSALLANAGTWNFDWPDTAQMPTGMARAAGSEVRTRSINASVQREMTDNLDLNVDFSVNENYAHRIHDASQVTGVSTTIAASSPFNPFNEALYVSFPNSDVAPYETTSTRTNASIGLVAQLPREWIAMLDYTYSYNRFTAATYGDDSNVRRAIFTSTNLFVDPILHPLDTSPWVYPINYDGESILHSVAARGSGKLWELPTGAVMATAGLDYRLSIIPDRTVQDADKFNNGATRVRNYFEREAQTLAGYYETSFPLVPVGRIPGAHSLEAQVSGRAEQYEVTTGTSLMTTLLIDPPRVRYTGPTKDGQPFFDSATFTSTDFTVGLKYSPIRSVMVRASRSTAFLPPLASQLTPSEELSPFQTQIVDPRFVVPGDPNSGSYGVFTRGGGNPDLRPQSSTSWNGGVIWSPTHRWLKGFRFNVEYYNIEQFNAIGSIPAPLLVLSEDVFPGRVERDPVSGMVTVVDTSLMNLFGRETEGIDVSVDYTLQTGKGRYQFVLRHSRILHLKEQLDISLPETEGAGYHPYDGGASRDRVNFSIYWDWQRWNASWTTNYVSGYAGMYSTGGPGHTLYPTNQSVFGTHSVGSFLNHDLTLGYSFPSSGGDSRFGRLLEGIGIQVGIRNVFDKMPPYDEAAVGNYYYSANGNMLKRNYWISVKKSF